MSSDATDNTMRAEFDTWLAGWKPQYVGDKPMRDETFFAGYQAARADTVRQVAEAVAAEREACAEVCDGLAQMAEQAHSSEAEAGCDSCAIAIRARSTPSTDASQWSKPDREPSD